MFWRCSWGRPPAQDLIGYWPFDEVVDVDGARATPDNSPDGGHYGMMTDAAELAEDAERGTVLNLGDFNNGAAISVPSFTGDDPDAGPGFNAIVESQNATISFWMNRQEIAATSEWTFLFDNAGTRQLGSHAPWGDNNLYFDVSGCCGANQRISTSIGDASTDGLWHHLAYVKRKDDGWDKAVTAVYLDGNVLVSSPGWPDNPDEATIDDVVPITVAGIGGQSSGAESHAGLMDDFAIWNEALDEDRIVALASGGGVIPLPPGAVVGDFNMDGAIDTSDFAIMAENFNAKFSAEEAFFKGDMDGNTRINMNDFIAFRTLYESQPGGQVASVPEPSTFALLAMACGALLGVWRRRR